MPPPARGTGGVCLLTKSVLAYVGPAPDGEGGTDTIAILYNLHGSKTKATLDYVLVPLAAAADVVYTTGTAAAIAAYVAILTAGSAYAGACIQPGRSHQSMADRHQPLDQSPPIHVGPGVLPDSFSYADIISAVSLQLIALSAIGCSCPVVATSSPPRRSVVKTG